MVSGEADITIMSHKEEGTSCIKSDAVYRFKIRDKLSECLHPLNSDIHPESLVDVVAGQIYNSKAANADESVRLGYFRKRTS